MVMSLKTLIYAFTIKMRKCKRIIKERKYEHNKACACMWKGGVLTKGLRSEQGVKRTTD